MSGAILRCDSERQGGSAKIVWVAIGDLSEGVGGVGSGVDRVFTGLGSTTLRGIPINSSGPGCKAR